MDRLTPIDEVMRAMIHQSHISPVLDNGSKKHAEQMTAFRVRSLELRTFLLQATSDPMREKRNKASNAYTNPRVKKDFLLTTVISFGIIVGCAIVGFFLGEQE